MDRVLGTRDTDSQELMSVQLKKYLKKKAAAATYPGSVGLALVATSKDQDDGENDEDDGEQDAHIIMWLKIKQRNMLSFYPRFFLIF